MHRHPVMLRATTKREREQHQLQEQRVADEHEQGPQAQSLLTTAKKKKRRRQKGGGGGGGEGRAEVGGLPRRQQHPRRRRRYRAEDRCRQSSRQQTQAKTKKKTTTAATAARGWLHARRPSCSGRQARASSSIRATMMPELPELLLHAVPQKPLLLTTWQFNPRTSRWTKSLGGKEAVP